MTSDRKRHCVETILQHPTSFLRLKRDLMAQAMNLSGFNPSLPRVPRDTGTDMDYPPNGLIEVLPTMDRSLNLYTKGKDRWVGTVFGAVIRGVISWPELFSLVSFGPSPIHKGVSLCG